MDSLPPITPGKRVQSERFGFGTVEYDKGITTIVRFDHGIEECERSSLIVVRSVADSLADSEWDPALPVISKILASAIISVNDSWGVFSRSRIALLPHQLWVCRRVLQNWPARWLVADDVGLGKTIEAGLILWPLLSKRLVRRLLIICPASLVEQWQHRLRTMFDIRLTRYAAEADTGRSDFWNTHDSVVVSLQTLRIDSRGRHDRLLESPAWDLVIVDEAHHLGADEDTGLTLGYRIAQRLVEEKKVESMIFFTGTPHRGKNFAFLALLRLLRPDLFDPRLPLRSQLPRLREAVIRNNKQSVTDLKGNRLFQPPRVRSETYTYSPEEARFYEMLTDFILTGKAYASTLGASDQRLVHLVLTAMQKLASSSVAAIRRALRGRLERLVQQHTEFADARRQLADLKQTSTSYTSMEEVGNEDELSRLEETLASLAGMHLMEDEEPRLQELLQAAEDVRRETKVEKILTLVQTDFAERSVLIFTEYKATQSLLMSELMRRYGNESVAFINGDGRADEVIDETGRVRTIRQTREDAADRFNNGSVRFLISTEAAGEGIDLQENCHSLIHADLPWNPMRLHQRVGRLLRYGQTKQVEVITLRNPETVEARIWDKLNQKLESIMLAFGHVMDEPEDLLQMVLGMTSPGLFRELFAEAPAVSADSLVSWFDRKAATFGGREVIETVKEIVGHCDRFDYQSMGREVPPVDLPDLRPFMELMLARNRRRPRRGEDGSLSFKTPEAWLGEVGVRSAYEHLVFDRSVRGKGAVQQVIGVGHKVFEQAVRQAVGDTSCVACISNSLLRRPLVVARVVDRVTGGESPVRSVIFAAEQDEDSSTWSLMRDWEVVRLLNKLGEGATALRKGAVPQEDQVELRESVCTAVAMLNKEAPLLETSFRIPSVELLAVLWPGKEDARLHEGLTGIEQSEDLVDQPDGSPCGS